MLSDFEVFKINRIEIILCFNLTLALGFPKA